MSTVIDGAPDDMTEEELGHYLKTSKYPDTDRIPNTNLADLFKVPENSQYVYERFSEEFERYKVKIDLFKWLVGTIGLTLITFIINWGFKDREQGLAEIQMYDRYASQTVVFAENPSNRVLLAQFYANVTPSEKLKSGWKDYLNVVIAEKNLFDQRLKRLDDTVKTLALDTSKSEKNKAAFLKAQEKQYEFERVNSIKLVDEKAPIIGFTSNSGQNNLALAQKFEIAGFESLLAKNMDAAIYNFTMSEKSYNGYHNAYNIAKFLSSVKPGFVNKQENWSDLYTKIISQYSWGIPSTLKQRLIQK